MAEETKRKVGRPKSAEKSTRRHFTITGLALMILEGYESGAQATGASYNASKLVSAALCQANKDPEFRAQAEKFLIQPTKK